MKLLSLLAACFLAAQLPLIERAAAQNEPTKSASADAPTGESNAPTKIVTPEGEIEVNLPPGTKSVLKRPPAENSVSVRAGYEGPALVPVPPAKIVDPAVRQASGFTADTTASTTNSQTNGSAKGTADLSDAAQAAAAAAADLMAQGLAAPKESAVVGRPATLLELIARAGNDRNRQAWVVRGYWKLSVAQADYNWAVDELSRLEQISAAKGLESSILSATQAAAQARMHEAQVGVVAAQQELVDLLGITGNAAQLPLTADPPLVGPYRTYFDTLFASRTAPPRTRAIDRGLPIRLEAIQSRTAAVQAASSAVHYAEESRAKGQTDLQTLLNCHADLSRQRRAFLTTVRDYNLDIGDYSLAVADPALSNERLVAMMILIKAPTPLTAVGQTEPTLARPPSDDALLQPAAPADSADNAGRNGVRRTGGADGK